MDRIIAAVIRFYHEYTFLAIIIALGVAVCFLRNPKEFLKSTAVLAVLGTAVYFFILLFGDTLSTGASQKDRVIHKTREAAGE